MRSLITSFLVMLFVVQLNAQRSTKPWNNGLNYTKQQSAVMSNSKYQFTSVSKKRLDKTQHDASVAKALVDDEVVNGINIAWVNYGRDTGVDPNGGADFRADLQQFGEIMDFVATNDGNVLRWWYHVNGSTNPVFDANQMVAPNPQFFHDDVISILDLAASKGVKMQICLWSFDMLKDQWASDPVANKLLLTEDAYMNAYINNALVPLVEAVGDHPGLYAWEIFNEPEGMTNEYASHWPDFVEKVEMPVIQKFINRTAGAIHRAQPGVKVTNGALGFLSATDNASQGWRNNYTDAALIAAGGDADGYLDLYNIHYYSWAGVNGSPFHNTFESVNLDKPAVIAEYYPDDLSVSSPTISGNDLGTKLMENNWAGSLSWSWTDRTSQQDRANMAAIMTSIAALNPDDTNNTIPVASFSTNTTSGDASLTVAFDASQSSDADGDSLAYTWDFGDGNTGSGQQVNHTYISAGTYTATLTVIDGNGGEDTEGVTIQVNGVVVAPTGNTIYVDNGKILSACDEEIVMRGYNEMFIWSSDRTGAVTLPEIAKTGSNAVRLVWTTEGDEAEFDQLITNSLANNMVPVAELHDATGDFSKLQMLLDYWKRPAVLDIIQKHKKWLIVNIGNEVGGGSESVEQFVAYYKDAITQLRDAGIDTPLMIDAGGWGNQERYVLEGGQELLEHDPLKNVIFSVHTYWLGGGDSGKIERLNTMIADARQKNLTLIIGEGPQLAASPSSCTELFPYNEAIEILENENIGWLSWSWGLVNNNDCGSPNSVFDVTTDGKFGNWATDFAEDISITDPNSIQNTSIIPQSLLAGPDAACGATLFTITASAETGGSITPSGNVLVAENTDRTFTITTQNAGYKILDVSVDGASVGAVSTYTFTNVTSNHSINVTFESVPVIQEAYPDGIPHAIPGTIDPVNYDTGGIDFAYYDTTPGNAGNGLRTDEDVDTEISNGTRNNIGAIADGEWLEYTVNVAETATYTFEADVASTSSDGAFHVEFDGNPITQVITVNSTGDWFNFVKQSVSNIQLTEGEHVMRVFMDRGLFNLSTLSFVKEGDTSNTNPVASFTSSITSGDAPLTVTFNASESSDIDGDSLSYSWDFGDGTSGSGVEVSHTFTTAGSYTVTLSVNDGNGGQNATSTTITVNGDTTNPGNCNFNVPSTSAVPSINDGYEYVYVLGSGGPNLSHVTAFSINWDLNNNGLYVFAIETNNGVPNWYVNLLSNISQTFNQSQPEATLSNTGIAGLDGDYWVTVDNGNFIMASKAGGFTLYFSNSETAPNCDDSEENTVPVASLSASPLSGTVALEVTFDASGSSDADGDSLSFTLDFGDGNTTTTSTAVHTYTAAGTYTATVTVNDGNGGIATADLTITVEEDVPPVNTVPVASLTASPLSGTVPLEVTFDASGSSDGDGDSLSFTLDFGDGNTTTTNTASHTYTVAGTYTATLTVNDGNGGVANAEVVITVEEDVPPPSNDCTFGAPLASSLPSINGSYTNAHVLGNGPNLETIEQFNIQWDLNNNAIYDFAFGTSDGNPSWWVNLTANVTSQLNTAQPELTIASSGIAGFDGTYWAAIDDGNFVLVSQTGDFTVYLSNSDDAPTCNNQAQLSSKRTRMETLLYPNPSSGQFNLKIDDLDTEKTVSVGLYDFSGRRLQDLSHYVRDGRVEFGEDLPAGVYFVKIENGNGFNIVKVVKSE